ncbi:RidA family protein [Glaciimonas sp. PCH181]|uniref:RidA family protein n=1 Tax=Glaciimonas sp. PCH181 TaxID=2133943 RepID=UPI000D38352D|nr:RidA family protein [Glaciimonas sp. PCH181]PUA19096.1 hypothetical protein C7W93_04145 [Glaciimonas sp. PCH181]
MTTKEISRINIGVRLSDVSIFNNVAYLAGRVPRNSIALGLKEQTAEVLADIERLLKEAGSDKSQILSCQIFLKDIAQIAEMNAAWDEWIPKGHCPSRATVQAQLANPQWGVEIVVTGAVLTQ